jgi:hypothetical protein
VLFFTPSLHRLPRFKALNHCSKQGSKLRPSPSPVGVVWLLEFLIACSDLSLSVLLPSSVDPTFFLSCRSFCFQSTLLAGVCV